MVKRPVKVEESKEKRLSVLISVLLEDQKGWISDSSPVKFWSKSRRIGASWTDACDSVLKAAAQNGMDCLYIGYSEDMTREYIDACAFWIDKLAYAAGEMQEFMFEDQWEVKDPDGTSRVETKQIKAFRINFASGFKILALSSRPRSIRGKQGKVTIDEAAYHDEFEDLLAAALALLIWGGQVCVLSSHNGVDNPFNVKVEEIKAGKWPYSLHETTFRKAISQGLYHRVCLRLGRTWTQDSQDTYVTAIYAFYGERAGEELDCIPRQGSGTYLPRTIVERCMKADIPTLRFKQPDSFVLQDDRLEITRKWFNDHVKPLIDALPQHQRTCFGQDFGRSGDLSAMAPLTELGVGRWRQVVNLELRNIPFDCQQLILFLLLDNLPLFFHAKFDARGNGSAHAEAALQRYGSARVECVQATTQWYAEFMPKYKAALEQQSFEMAGDKLHKEDILADHRRAILDKGNPKIDDGRDKGSDGGYRHGDTLVGNLMAWSATLVEGQPPAGETIAANDAELPSGRFAGRPRHSIFGKRAA